MLILKNNYCNLNKKNEEKDWYAKLYLKKKNEYFKSF